MSRADDEQKNPLLRAIREGRLDKSVISKAAGEMLAIGDFNRRKREVDGEGVASGPEEICCLEARLPDGRWRLTTMKCYGSSPVSVIREDRENLLPGLKWDLIIAMARSGRFNEFLPAKEHVQERCTFRITSMP